MKFLALIGFLFISLASVQAESIRFSELAQDELSNVLKGKANQTVEFRKGDLIPLSFKVRGNLLSLAKNYANILKVEKDFFIKANRASIKISFDGYDYVDLKDALSGSLTVGASGSSIPSILNILLHVEER